MINFLKKILPNKYLKLLRGLYLKINYYKIVVYTFLNQLKLPKEIKNKIKSDIPLNVNLCSGDVKIEGYVNIDLWAKPDIYTDLENSLIPLPNSSVQIVVMMSAINYFSRERAYEIIEDIFRVLKPSGILRIGVQDLNLLSKKYIDRDEEFYFQKLDNGRDRFPGETFADKINYFFIMATQVLKESTISMFLIMRL